MIRYHLLGPIEYEDPNPRGQGNIAWTKKLREAVVAKNLAPLNLTEVKRFQVKLIQGSLTYLLFEAQD